MGRTRAFPYRNNIYRSEYERQQAKRLVNNKVKFEYETRQMEFKERVIGGQCGSCGSKEVVKHRKYTPDFYFPDTDIFVETKGKFDPKSRTKMKNVIGQSKEDIRMVFMYNNFLTKKHKMRYGRWCDINGVKWVVGDIPLEWTK